MAATALKARAARTTGATPPAIDREGDQVLREPARIVGRSGRVYGMLGANGKAEILTIRPADAAAKPKREKGVQVYDTGGEVKAATYDEWGRPLYDPNTDTNYGYSGPPLGAPAATAPTAPTAQPANTTPTAVAGATPNPSSGAPYGAAGVTQFQNQQNVNAAREASIDASRNVQPAAAAQIDASRASIAAAARAQEATKTALGSSAAYTTAQEKANAEALAAEKGIQAASLNFADKAAVAHVAAARQNEDTLYRVAGYQPPVEVETPSGAGGFVQLPGGGVARATAKTQEQMLTEGEKRAGALRILELTKQKLAAERAGDVAAAARIDASLEALKAQAAGLNVDAAQLGVSAANLGVSQANLNLNKSQQPPAPGQVFNDYTQTWMTRSERDIDYARRDLVKDPTDPTGGTFVTKADLAARTDSAGNIMRADGVLISPERNELRDGVWIDPKTGNRYLTDPMTGAPAWVSPDGLVFRDNLWWDTGFGGYQRNDGSFYNPLTGQVKFAGQIFSTDAGYANTRGGGGGGSAE